MPVTERIHLSARKTLLLVIPRPLLLISTSYCPENSRLDNHKK